MRNPTLISAAPGSAEKRETMEQSRTAYQSAKESTDRAQSVKYGSIYVAGIVFIGALLVYRASPSERYVFPVISLSMVAAAVLLLSVTHLWSMICNLRARALEIRKGSTVNSSPVLSDAARAQVAGPANQENISQSTDRPKAA